jgi:hypothetical protein
VYSYLRFWRQVTAAKLQFSGCSVRLSIMETIKVDPRAFCASAVDAPLHPWAIHTGMQFRAVPSPDQSSSTVDPQWLGTVVTASRKQGIVLQLADNTRVKISDEQLRSVNYSCPDGSDSRDEQWGCEVVKFSCQTTLGMQSVRSPLDYILDLIHVGVNPDLLIDADVLAKNSLQELRGASHQRASSDGQFSSQGVSCSMSPIFIIRIPLISVLPLLAVFPSMSLV